MEKFFEPAKENWNTILQRPVFDNKTLTEKVQQVIDEVRKNGDSAVKQYTQQFDGVTLNDITVSQSEIDAATSALTEELKQAIQVAYKNIYAFHLSQKEEIKKVETIDGVSCWRKSVGIEKVGLYIPGGSAPLFSTVLMLAIPAQIAGCKEIVLCTPPLKDSTLNPALLYCAQLCGVNKIYKTGGVQAIASMAYGTETVPKVYKIFGPGNQFVTCAKQLVQQDGVAIDMPAGPSEVCVLADETADAVFVAADMLSQAEHGADSQFLLVCTTKDLAEKVEKQINAQLLQLPRKTIAEKSIENSKIIYFEKMTDAVDFVNEYAAEHLIISCKDAEAIGENIINAGSVFLGNYSPESAGDYASGTNHTLPTNGYAKAYSGVSVDSFVKKITYQQLSQQGLQNISDAIIAMAEAEGLDAHAYAVKCRINNESE